MEYDVYHDESKEGGYWHGIMLVPRTTRALLLGHLAKIRSETSYGHPLTLKRLDRRNSSRFQCMRAWVQVGMLALIQDTKGKVEKVYVSRKIYGQADGLRTEHREVAVISEPLGVRFILFRERDDHRRMDPAGIFLDYGAKVETTFRMGLKGGLHCLFDVTDPAVVTSIHFDGFEHHSGRRIDLNRIVRRIRGLRENCSFSLNLQVDDQRSDHRLAEAQAYDDCQLLQLTDLLVGCFRTVIGECKNDVQREVATPVKVLVDKWAGGPARMRNSRWYRGFCMSECYLEDGQWMFDELPGKAKQQATLF